MYDESADLNLAEAVSGMVWSTAQKVAYACALFTLKRQIYTNAKLICRVCFLTKKTNKTKTVDVKREGPRLICYIDKGGI